MTVLAMAGCHSSTPAAQSPPDAGFVTVPAPSPTGASARQNGFVSATDPVQGGTESPANRANAGPTAAGRPAPRHYNIPSTP